jgi:hypothetical protein
MSKPTLEYVQGIGLVDVSQFRRNPRGELKTNAAAAKPAPFSFGLSQQSLEIRQAIRPGKYSLANLEASLRRGPPYR